MWPSVDIGSPAHNRRIAFADSSSQDIAKQILVSVKTVETYRARIAEKLGLRTHNEIVRFAVQMGLLTSDTLATVPPRDQLTAGCLIEKRIHFAVRRHSSFVPVRGSTYAAALIAATPR
jgi:hypothetical protein